MSADALRDVLAKYGVPDPALVSKLPKGGRRDADNQTCRECGGWHKPGAVHLDYMGHAEVTRALIEIDPEWEWAPFALDADGLPAVRQRGSTLSLWGRLTLLGKTRPGVGTCPAGKEEAEKELVGDFLRNAAMRFGIALSLWSKSEWEDHEGELPPVEMASDAAYDTIGSLLDALTDDDRKAAGEWWRGHLPPLKRRQLTVDQATQAIEHLSEYVPAEDAGRPFTEGDQ